MWMRNAARDTDRSAIPQTCRARDLHMCGCRHAGSRCVLRLEQRWCYTPRCRTRGSSAGLPRAFRSRNRREHQRPAWLSARKRQMPRQAASARRCCGQGQRTRRARQPPPARRLLRRRPLASCPRTRCWPGARASSQAAAAPGAIPASAAPTPAPLSQHTRASRRCPSPGRCVCHTRRKCMSASNRSHSWAAHG